MNIIWNKITLHNFGSYGHSEVKVSDKGFCLVSGENNYKKDCAVSNGSGKSFLWSALCYALTGETIQGLKKNLKNLNVDENDCYTSVEFTVNEDNFVVTRYAAPKSDLTIIKNSVDISGKTFTESCKILGENLPDLTKDLISSTVIIGQSMPNKFSSFSPKGRKELLEKLTKSEFMIENIKERIKNRLDKLNETVKTYDESILVHNTQINSAKGSLSSLLNELNTYTKVDYDAEIDKVKNTITVLNSEIADIQQKITNIEEQITLANNDLLKFTANKSKEINDENLSYSQKSATTNIDITKLEGDIRVIDSEVRLIQQEINRINSIKTVCPTCGQKLIGVEKPSTKDKEEVIAEKLTHRASLAESLTKVKESSDTLLVEHQNNQTEIDKKYSSILINIQSQLNNFKSFENNLKNSLSEKTSQLSAETVKQNKLEYDKENSERYYSSLLKKQEEVNSQINTLTDELCLVQKAKDEIMSHVELVKKMETLAKRDFRGYLLSNIIDYLDSKAKEYSEIVFGTRELNIYLDDNDLDISYCGKLLDNLSGGERQRVDVIIQFALRDLLSTQSNYSSNILVLDEIFDNMDKLATERIVNLINDRLKDIESVFIVSHHADELELSYDTTLKVIKNEDGISSVE